MAMRTGGHMHEFDGGGHLRHAGAGRYGGQQISSN